MKYLIHIGSLALYLLTVETTLAAVSINEVAWMGSGESANHEWIELSTTGGTTVVDGWTLSDGMNLEITLSGTLEDGAYAVLERTSEASAPGTAFFIYTGALVNTGATLTLRDSTGAIQDQVPGGENWETIGGDNVTKETAQYTTSGWVTDSATPGRVNGTGRIEEESTTETPSPTTGTTNKITSSSGSKKSSETVRLKNSETKMSVSPDVQSVAYVHQRVPFGVETTGLEEKASMMVRYDWNFGDSFATSGKKVTHTYEYPGKYVVTVQARKGTVTQVARHEITVLPVTFSITRNEEGDVQIHNDAPYDVDLSGYVVRGEKSITLPPRTVILPRATITIAKERLGGRGESLVMLHDQAKNLVASTLGSVANTVRVEASSVPTQASIGFTDVNPSTVVTVAPAEGGAFSFLPLVAEASTTPEALVAGESTTTGSLSTAPITAEETAPEMVAKSEQRWPYIAFIALLITALIGLSLGKKQPTV